MVYFRIINDCDISRFYSNIKHIARVKQCFNIQDNLHPPVYQYNPIIIFFETWFKFDADAILGWLT